MLTILYFARLRDQLALGQEQLALPTQINTALQLRDYLCQRSDIWQQTLMAHGILMAVNQTVITGDQPLTGDEEVAFFPPVTGG